MEIGAPDDVPLTVTFTRSESIAAIGLALSKAQGEFPHAKADSVNPHFKSTYADLASVIDAVGPYLSKYQIARVQCPFTRGESVGVYTMLVHAGEFVGCEVSCSPSQRTPQAIGTVFSYLRRYSLAAIAGVAQVDDDGNLGSGKGEAPTAPAVAPQARGARRQPPRLDAGEPTPGPTPKAVPTTPESAKPTQIAPGVATTEIPAGKVPIFVSRAGRWEQKAIGDPLSEGQQARVKILQKELGIQDAEWRAGLTLHFGKTSSKQLTSAEADELARRLESRKAIQQPA